MNQKKDSLPADRRPVLVDGVRTPFLKTNGAYSPFESHDLGRFSMSGLLQKTGLDPKEVGHVIYGTVIHNPPTSNVARECMLSAGLPVTTPAHTVALACISSNVAATSAMDMMMAGRIDTAIVGGTDSLSDPPIRLSKNIRQALSRLQKAKSPAPFLKELKNLNLSDLKPDIPAVSEFSNGFTMGQGCERMAKAFGVTREESDSFGARSHQLAARAQKGGLFDEDLVPIHVPPKFGAVTKDDGPREETTVEGLGKLRPAFDKKFGIVTAGSASFLTDGASACLMMTEKKAKDMGYAPKAILEDYIYCAGDPLEEMLLGPALSIPPLLEKNNLSIKDIGVWEIHEAFAAQVVCFMKALDSDEFCKNRLGLKGAMGTIPLDKLNSLGGSLSLGHPFGATGGRLITTAANRLQREDQKWAIVSGCAAGGHGSAILLKNPNYNGK